MGVFTQNGSRKPSNRPSFIFAGVVTTSLFFWTFFKLPLDSIPFFSRLKPDSYKCNQPDPAFNLQFDPPISTFYDDPTFGYTFDTPIKDWDQKRMAWLELHPTFLPKLHERVFLVTSSKSTPCKSPTGDHYLLRTYRNKVDYCRIHGYDIFYNNVLLDPKMTGGWGKLPAVRAAMLAHPEAEWIWWLDEDTVITDMEFKIPFHKYKNYNFVVHGWPKEVYVKKSWVGLNDGSFLIRNCQCSLDLLDMWADMGPRSPNLDMWTKVLSDEFKHGPTDQTALAYLIWKKQHESFGKKMLIEKGYYLDRYWIDIVDTLEDISEKNMEIEKSEGILRRPHAEKVNEAYALLRDSSFENAGNEFRSLRRPFVTHFAGCQPCNGKHNPLFTGEDCRNGMNKALSFADNQVLRNYGFVQRNLLDPSVVSSVPFVGGFFNFI